MRASAEKPGFRLTDRDVELLGWVARQRMVIAAHVQAHLGVGPVVAYRRLAGLVSVGLLEYRRIFHAQPGIYLATNGGLAVCGSVLPRPTVDLRSYDHDLGVVWLDLMLGRRGVQVVGEREMRSQDRRVGHGELFAVAMAGSGPAGQPRISTTPT